MSGHLKFSFIVRVVEKNEIKPVMGIWLFATMLTLCPSVHLLVTLKSLFSVFNQNMLQQLMRKIQRFF